MLSAKIATTLIALILLAPFAASFWIMSTYRARTEAEMKASLDKALEDAKADIDAQVTPGFPGAMGVMVQIIDQISIPVFTHRLWLLYPRRWVGVAGLVSVAVVATLILASTWIPGHSVVGSYGKDGGPYQDPPPQPIDPSRLIFLPPDHDDQQPKKN